ncbi:MAG: hypothetical protein WCA14_06685, partial [Steroidobacteraceae bacterium]
MHLARRGYLLAFLAAVLAILGIWSDSPRLWPLPLGLLLLGLTVEALYVRKVPLGAGLATAPRALLGRPQPAAFVFENPTRRPLVLEYAPALP